MHSRRDVASLLFIKSSLRRLDFNQYELSDPCTVISRQAEYSICTELVKQCVVIEARPLLRSNLCNTIIMHTVMFQEYILRILFDVLILRGCIV